MIDSNFAQSVRQLLSTRLFDLSGTPVTVASIVSAAAIILVSIWVSRLLRRAIELFFRRRGVKPRGSVDAITRLVHYLVMLAGLGLAMQALGISFAALFAAGAVFAVGLGFAMQNITQNFVSGVILLAERAIRKGDVVRIEGELVRVEEMGIRSTLVKNRDGLELIVPNSTIVQSTVANYTLNSSEYRVRITVGVSYASDLDAVHQLLYQVAKEPSSEWIHTAIEPQVVLSNFADSAVEFQIAVWLNDPWHERAAISALRFAVWRAFQNSGVVIAFPQLDLHLDEKLIHQLAKANP